MAKIPYPREDQRAGHGVPALQLTKRDPRLGALVSKARKGRDPVERDGAGNRRPAVHDAALFYTMLQRRGRRNSDAQAVMAIMPDIELSAQILISSIKSPKDMASAVLIYGTPKDLFAGDLNGSVISELDCHFRENYKIQTIIDDMLREPLFEKGSYPVAVIPENALDAMINGTRRISTEALKPYTNRFGMTRTMGVLGSYKTPAAATKVGFSFEAFKQSLPAEDSEDSAYVHYLHENWTEYNAYNKEPLITVTDNPAVLRFSKLKDKIRSGEVIQSYHQNGLKSALESHTEDISDFRVEQAIFRSGVGGQERTASVPHQYELGRKSVGNPLIMKLPSESVIPIHVPNNPKQHVGYFVVLDEDGHPIEVHEGDPQSLGMARGGGGTIGNNIMNRVKANFVENDGFDPMNQAHMKMAYRVYGDLIERDLISRVKNGKAAADVAVASNEEVYRLMLSRVLAGRHTQLLYIPVEYMTYIAFMYTPDGLGQSLLDRQSQLNMIRSVLFFSELVGSVKSSIGRTKVQINLDPTDPNPMKTLELAMDEIVRSRTVVLPMGMNPQDTMEFIQKAGYEWDVSGHPGLPDTKFEFVPTQSQVGKPDADLQERLRKASIMALGLSPEIVDNGFNAEFATTAVANNILLAKRVIMWQDLFTPQLSDHLRKVARNTESIVSSIKALLNEHFDSINLKLEDVPGATERASDLAEADKKRLIVSHALNLLFQGFTVELPRPSAVTNETQLKEVQDYSLLLDEVLKSQISPELFFKGAVGDMSQESAQITAMFKAHFMRRWLAETSIAPEIAEMTMPADGEDILDSPTMKAINQHIRTLTRVATKGLIDMKSNADAADKDLKKHNVDLSGTMGDAGSSFGGGGGGGFGDLGGGSSLGGFDMGGGDFGGVTLGTDLTGTPATSDNPDVGSDELPATQLPPAEGQAPV